MSNDFGGLGVKKIKFYYFTVEINDIRLISDPIHALNHELEDTDTNIPLTRVASKRILVELLGIRRERLLLYLWGMNPLAYI